MILKHEIASFAEKWNVQPTTVDKDYVLGHFLNSFYSIDSHRSEYVFKGGTCLRKCYFPDYRFSEDLDFTFIGETESIDVSFFGKVIAHCEKQSGILLYVKGFRPKFHNNVLKGYECTIPFWGANHSKNQSPPSQERWHTKIKVDISTDESLISPIQNQPIFHPYSDNESFIGISIPVYSLNEILAEKIRSFFQRSYHAPRDYYDAWFLLNNFVFENKSMLKDLIEEKMKAKGLSWSEDIFNDEAIFRTLETNWKNSLAHQLSPEQLPKASIVWEFLRESLPLILSQMK